MYRKGLPISEFKKGDIITRLERAPFNVEEYNENLGFTTTVTEHSDGSWMGDPLELIGIENNRIYVKHLIGIFKNSIHDLPLEQFENGWGIFVDIAGILK